jgi:hypothetical protein
MILILLNIFIITFTFVQSHGNYPVDTFLQLTRESDVVVQGVVLRVFSSRDAPRSRQANGMPGSDEMLKQHSLLWIRIDQVHKTDVELEHTIYAHSWSLYHAPMSCNDDDRCDRGLITVARANDHVQVFLKRDKTDGSLHLIQPNGLELLMVNTFP